MDDSLVASCTKVATELPFAYVRWHPKEFQMPRRVNVIEKCKINSECLHIRGGVEENFVVDLLSLLCDFVISLGITFKVCSKQPSYFPYMPGSIFRPIALTYIA